MIKNNKTIWYISKYANLRKYGADTRQIYFCKEFYKKGCNVTLFISNSSHLYNGLPMFSGYFKEEIHEGVNVVWLNTIKYKEPSSLLRVLSWFHFELLVLVYGVFKKKKKPDVVICSSLSILSIISGLFFKVIYHNKVIFEIRDIWPQSLIELRGMKKNHPLVIFLSFIEKIGYKYSDVIVGTMPKLHIHVQEKIKKNKKVIYIPHGVSLNFYEEQQEKIQSEYIDKYFSKNMSNLVYAGSFNKAYDLMQFIQLARESEGKNNLNFIFIGDGVLKKELITLSKSLSNVTIAPKVSREKLYSVLENADILLHSFSKKNVFRFGVSPNKFIDYMYAGKPIICIGDVYCPMLLESGSGIVIHPDHLNVFYDKVNFYLSMSENMKKALASQAKKYISEELCYKKLACRYFKLF
ncbi:glycosyltransferase family 4 protein [Marinomonas primoryensis]|uniref:Glycosyl transferase family 1 domain-containing protein n=1 Tax=Marinomonas primoryensis TaxID=178399 RepID=A0A859D4Q2_9GAMM|nr:glycosyltransferase family 4 protein [Marinomonas primoryensis]QKK81961.1 uncharacterized protein MP3633_3234 [Marinomonas primoryensis]